MADQDERTTSSKPDNTVGGGTGDNGPTEIPEESVNSESELKLDDLDARREPGKKQGEQ